MVKVTSRLTHAQFLEELDRVYGGVGINEFLESLAVQELFETGSVTVNFMDKKMVISLSVDREYE